MSKRDYFFEFAETNFAIYFHIVDTAISVILIRNNNVTSIKVFRNFRLNKLIEIKHSNVLHVDSKSSDFAIRILKSKHKKLFFDKVLKSILLTYKKEKHTAVADVFLSINNDADIVLFNDITIHNASEKNVIQRFSNLIEKYSSL